MKKILIIGSKGMAGHILYYHLKELEQYHIADISRSDDFFPSTYQFDISAFDQLTAAIQNEKPDIIINCAGILNQDAEMNPHNAILINSYLPHFLAKKGAEFGYKLIHLSTDCIFSGNRGGYRKADTPDGTGFYARSKALGEVDYSNHLTLRTSIVGPELKHNGIGLFDWFMRQSGTIKGYTRAIWTGITTIELAKCICVAIEKDISGIHHLVNGDAISKYELLNLFQKVFKRKNIDISRFHEYESDKSLLKEDSLFTVKSYGEMITDMKEWLLTHKNVYADYYFS